VHVPNVLIAEPNQTLLEGIKSILLKMPNIVVVAQAMHRHDVFNSIRNHSVDLIVLEPLMGGAMGEAFIRQLARLVPNIPILAVTDLDESKYGVQALRAGLKGFVKKDCSKEELIYAVDRALSGKAYISPELSEIMLSGKDDNGESVPHTILTEREMEVCTRLAHGERVCDIAPRMMLSAKTISTHKSRAFEKLRISNTADLVRLFADHAYLKAREPKWSDSG
jgi:two-component system invasion response regulator UvrY